MDVERSSAKYISTFEPAVSTNLNNNTKSQHVPNCMAPSGVESPAFKRPLIRPRSLSLHGTNSICLSNYFMESACANHINHNGIRSDSEVRVDQQPIGNRVNWAIDGHESNSNKGSATSDSEGSLKNVGTTEGGSGDKSSYSNNRISDLLEEYGCEETTQQSPVTQSPSNFNILTSNNGEKRQSSKQSLRRIPSTPGSYSRLPTLSRHSSVRINRQAQSSSSGPLSSPTANKSPRQTLPTSPSTSTTALGGLHSKPHQNDQNPFGADLVRYQNGPAKIASNRVSTNTNRQISETSAGGSLYAMNSNGNEDTALLGKVATFKELALENKTPENKSESPVENRQTGVIFYKDTWGDENGQGGGAGGFLRNRFSTRRIRSRLMQKDGECNVSLHNVPKQKAKYFSDIFTTLVEVKWRWCLFLFAMGFLLSWLLFAIVYYLIIYTHGDFDHAQNDTNWKFCVYSINNFVSVFMFSLESQHTIGYGSRYPSEECPTIVATVCLQSMVGVMIQTFMAGIVFAKLARAKKRAETLIFSKNAVVCMRDGKLCFLFRVGDMRKSQLAEAHVRLQMISKRITNEGELLPFHQFDMNVGYDAGLDRIFVVWPITICHVIDENSPLYEYSADDLATARFEIIAILEGVVPSTGTTTQARTSYLPQEIIWGSRFEKLVTYQRENGEYRIDFSKFHNIYPQETPTCAARELDLLRVRPSATVRPMLSVQCPPVEYLDPFFSSKKRPSTCEAGLNLEEVYHVEGEEQAENQGLTPYSTVDSRMEAPRPSILPPKDERSSSVMELVENNNDGTVQDDVDETGHLLAPPPSASVLITMSPAERKASIAAAALAFRKNKSLSESARKVSLVACGHKLRKPSINVYKVSGTSEHATAVVTTPPQVVTPGHQDRCLRHASSTGSVAVSGSSPTPCPTTGCLLKPRPSSILREHDIM